MLSGGTWNSFAVWFALYILPRFWIEYRWECVTLLRRVHKQAQTHPRTPFIHISLLSPSLHRKPPFPGVHFFHYKGNWKGDGDYFFFFLPFSCGWLHAFEEELCHPGISTPCMHTLCSPRRPLHHPSLESGWRESGLHEGEKQEGKKKERKGILSLTNMHVNKGDDT